MYHILDSTLVRSQIQKETYGFNTFVATRLSEIQSKSDPSEWWWVESDKNPADMVTKPAHPTKLGIDSVRQRDPECMS